MPQWVPTQAHTYSSASNDSTNSSRLSASSEAWYNYCREQSRLLKPTNRAQPNEDNSAIANPDPANHSDIVPTTSIRPHGTNRFPCGDQVLTNGAAEQPMVDVVSSATDHDPCNLKRPNDMSTVKSRERNPVAFQLGLTKAPSQILRNSSVMNSVLSRFRSGAATKGPGNDERQNQQQSTNEALHGGTLMETSVHMDNGETHGAISNMGLSELDNAEGYVQVNNTNVSGNLPDLSDSIRSSSQTSDLQKKRGVLNKVPALDLTGSRLNKERTELEGDILTRYEVTPEPDDCPATRRSSTCLPFHAAEQSYIRSDVESKFWDHRPTSTAIDGEAKCAQCRARGAHISFCVTCSSTYDAAFCDSCWNSQIAHRSRDERSVDDTHQKLNADEFRLAKEVKNVLNVQPSSMREELFRQDAETAWFGVARDDGCVPIFKDYGRYANVVASTRDLHKGRGGWRARRSDISPTSQRRFPSLVSFVGQTGAGKSSIVKLLIDLECSKPHPFATPIVGSSGNDAPTSDDVHLYPDPSTLDTNYPLLFADCEGLEGGTREPLAASFKKKAFRSNRVKVEPTDGAFQEHRYTARRELKWGNDTIYSREFAVTNLYPRLLYTFSDVIVFILKNPRTIESVLEKLVEWAAAALEKSSNQPVLPHVIIALNALDHTDEDLWDVEHSTRDLLDKLARCVHNNATFKRYAQFWRERHRSIETAEDLILSYYSSIKIVRIPNGERPNKVATQISALRTEIHIRCEVARYNKNVLRMLLDDEELDPYLQFAFDHFASTLDTPFDFVQASFVNSPIPHDFAGNILKLAINMMRLRQKDSAEDVFLDLSYMVASCIMLDNARSKLRGTAEDLFPPYFEHVLVALEDFTDRHWPCEYVPPGTKQRCVNVRSGHSSKGHQLANGNILADGKYKSSFGYEDYRPVFESQVYHQYTHLLKLVEKRRLERPSDLEERIAADVHKRETLCKFFKKASNFRPRGLINHTVCYTCLFEAPEHVLPCGHIICTPCAKSYGDFMEDTITMDRCPMEERARPQSWTIHLKPEAAGTRLLSLDGGGIRGIVELAVLQQIETELGNKLPIQTFFDLVIGTSTGGLIALGLGVKNWSVDECRTHFQRLCGKAFTRRRAGNLPVIGWIVDNHNHSKYRTRPLQEALVEAFSDDVNLFGGRTMAQHMASDITEQTGVKVGVTATSVSGSSVLFANYNRYGDEHPLYHFTRPERPELELRLWEAARSTSAAPKSFKPFHHEPTKQAYLDGGIYHNNPIFIAERERQLIHPSSNILQPDIVLSIGTAMNVNQPATPTSPQTPQTPRRGVFPHLNSLLKIAENHVESALDSEKTWATFIGSLGLNLEDRKRYVRINPRLTRDPPRLDEINALPQLEQEVKAKLVNDPMIRRVALHLLATTFYFQERKESESTSIVKGHIQCRLPSQSVQVQELASLLQAKSAPQGPYFTIKEQGFEEEAILEMSSPELERMKRSRAYQSSLVTLSLSSPTARFEIHLNFDRGEKFMLSGLPRQASRIGNWQHRSRLTPLCAKSRRSLSLREIKLARQNWKPPPPIEPQIWLTKRTYNFSEMLKAAEESDPSAPVREPKPALLTKIPNNCARTVDAFGSDDDQQEETEGRTPTDLSVVSNSETGEDVCVHSAMQPTCNEANTQVPTQAVSDDIVHPVDLSLNTHNELHNEDAWIPQVAEDPMQAEEAESASCVDSSSPKGSSSRAIERKVVQAAQRSEVDEPHYQPSEGADGLLPAKTSLDSSSNIRQGSASSRRMRRQKAKELWATCEANGITPPLHDQSQPNDQAVTFLENEVLSKGTAEDANTETGTLHWNSSEITGHRIDWAGGDDGSGFGGVGFTPTKREEEVRRFERRRQLERYQEQESQHETRPHLRVFGRMREGLDMVGMTGRQRRAVRFEQM